MPRKTSLEELVFFDDEETGEMTREEPTADEMVETINTEKRVAKQETARKPRGTAVKQAPQPTRRRKVEPVKEELEFEEDSAEDEPEPKPKSSKRIPDALSRIEKLELLLAEKDREYKAKLEEYEARLQQKEQEKRESQKETKRILHRVRSNIVF